MVGASREEDTMIGETIVLNHKSRVIWSVTIAIKGMSDVNVCSGYINNDKVSKRLEFGPGCLYHMRS